MCSFEACIRVINVHMGGGAGSSVRAQHVTGAPSARQLAAALAAASAAEGRPALGRLSGGSSRSVSPGGSSGVREAGGREGASGGASPARLREDALGVGPGLGFRRRGAHCDGSAGSGSDSEGFFDASGVAATDESPPGDIIVPPTTFHDAESTWRFPMERFVDDAATAASLRHDQKRALAWYRDQAEPAALGPLLSVGRSDAAALAAEEPVMDRCGASALFPFFGCSTAIRL